jgi:hypothetical protein
MLKTHCRHNNYELAWGRKRQKSLYSKYKNQALSQIGMKLEENPEFRLKIRSERNSVDAWLVNVQYVIQETVWNEYERGGDTRG